jgi:hypothetical protein
MFRLNAAKATIITIIEDSMETQLLPYAAMRKNTIINAKYSNVPKI